MVNGDTNIWSKKQSVIYTYVYVYIHKDASFVMLCFFSTFFSSKYFSLDENVWVYTVIRIFCITLYNHLFKCS